MTPKTLQMCLRIITTVTLLLGVVLANTKLDDNEWLDRLLEQYKDKLDKRAQKNKPLDLQVVVIKKPDDFKEPKNWNLESILRLLKLLKESKSSGPVLDVLRRTMKKHSVNFRGNDQDDPWDLVIRIKDHMQAELPHAEIRAVNVWDFLSPHDPANEQEVLHIPHLPPVHIEEALNGQRGGVNSGGKGVLGGLFGRR